MSFSARIPAAAAPLRDLVAALWHWKDGGKPREMERLMPSGEMTLVVNLHEDAVRIYDSASLRLLGTERGAVLVGAYSGPLVIDSEEQRNVFGVQFQAGGACGFFKQPVDELANAHVALDDLWRGGPELRSALLACGGDSQAMFDAAESLLLRRLWKDPHPAVRYAARQLQARPQRRVADLVDATGLSSRRFIQLFKEQAGLTPKMFGRLQRFQGAIGAAHGLGRARVDWCDVAMRSGYYDQSHLIRDFR